MLDLRISYTTRNGAVRFKEYRTIMEFTEDFEANAFDPEATLIRAVFFDKAIRTKHFNSMSELYDFCVAIMK